MSLKRKAERPWQEVAQEAQQYRDASIARVPGIERVLNFGTSGQLPKKFLDVPGKVIEQHDLQITEAEPEVLVDLLANGTLSSVEVTAAFLRRAALAQRLTNCITELLPDRSLSRAQELDHYFSKHGRPIGPLHGLPSASKK